MCCEERVLKDDESGGGGGRGEKGADSHPMNATNIPLDETNTALLLP